MKEDKLGNNIRGELDEGVRMKFYNNRGVDYNVDESAYDFVYVKIRNYVELIIWDKITDGIDIPFYLRVNREF